MQVVSGDVMGNVHVWMVETGQVAFRQVVFYCTTRSIRLFLLHDTFHWITWKRFSLLYYPCIYRWRLERSVYTKGKTAAVCVENSVCLSVMSLLDRDIVNATVIFRVCSLGRQPYTFGVHGEISFCLRFTGQSMIWLCRLCICIDVDMSV